MNRSTLVRVKMMALLVGCASGVAHAQSAAQEQEATAGNSLTDIVVTAQRREERLQTVPVAVAAISGDTLEQMSVQSTTDLGAVVPGLVIAPQNVSVATFIRGVGGFNVSPGDEAHVAIYVDGVYIASPMAGIFALNSVERVEVLKGPQGTLFGRNATAGVIQVITRDPSHDPRMDVELGYGNYDTRDLKLYATGGLGPGVAADIAVYLHDQNDGWGRNLTTGNDTFKGDEYAFRSKWLLDLGPDTQLTLVGDYTKSHPVMAPSYTPPGDGALVGGVTNAGFFNTLSNIDGYGKSRQWGGSATLRHDFGSLRLVSITSYREADSYFPLDNDASPAFIQQVLSTQSDKAWTQEIQLLSPASSKIDWILGGFFFYDKAAVDPQFRQTATATTQLASQQKTTSYAAFGQATGEIFDRTRLTLGLRYTHDKRDIDATVIAPAAITVVDNSATSSKLTWRLALDHQFNDNVMAYASYNRGFKSGLFNTYSPTTPAVRPETVDTYEIGLKTQIFDNRLRLNGAIFYNDFKDIQFLARLPTGAVFINAAAGKSQGAEVELEAVPAAGLTIRAAVSYIDSEYSSFENALFYNPLPAGGNSTGVGDASGNDFVRAPRWTGSLNASYTLPTEIGKFSLTGTVNYSDAFYFDAQNRIQHPDYALVNASLNWQSPNETWGIRLWARNLGDKRYYANIVPQTYGDTSLPGAPRTYGASLLWHL